MAAGLDSLRLVEAMLAEDRTLGEVLQTEVVASVVTPAPVQVIGTLMTVLVQATGRTTEGDSTTRSDMTTETSVLVEVL